MLNTQVEVEQRMSLSQKSLNMGEPRGRPLVVLNTSGNALESTADFVEMEHDFQQVFSRLQRNLTPSSLNRGRGRSLVRFKTEGDNLSSDRQARSSSRGLYVSRCPRSRSLGQQSCSAWPESNDWEGTEAGRIYSGADGTHGVSRMSSILRGGSSDISIPGRSRSRGSGNNISDMYGDRLRSQTGSYAGSSERSDSLLSMSSNLFDVEEIEEAEEELGSVVQDRKMLSCLVGSEEKVEGEDE